MIIQKKLLYPKILKKRLKDAHKKSHGQVLVIAGSKGMTGAAALACKATMRAGAGIVTLAYPESLKEIYKDLLVEVMTIPCPETADGTLSYKALNLLLEKSKYFDIVIVGPGLSKNNETGKLIQDLVAKLEKPIVLDADGLNALENKTDLFLKRKNRIILTPHEGEMARLTGLSMEEIKKNRANIAQKFAEKWGVVVVLKGHNTIIAEPVSEFGFRASFAKVATKVKYREPSFYAGRLVINKTGGSALATAGTGDVLCGIIGSLWAENIDEPFESACTGVYLHGLSGDLAEKELGERSVIASDVIEYLSKVIKKF